MSASNNGDYDDYENKEPKGYDDKDFQKWWHRHGKELFSGRDIDNAQQAQEVYDYWVSIGKPTIK